jgi:NAD+ synthase (glutamine-hydrolysing)
MKKKLIVGALVPEIKLGNPDYNADIIIQKLAEADSKGVEVLATPELSLTGATVGDLFFQELLIQKTEAAILKVCEATNNLSITLILGTPLRINSKLYNVALIINKGKIIGFVPKKELSWRETRWFSNGSELYRTKVNALNTNLSFDRNVFEAPNHQNAFFAITLSTGKVEYLNPQNQTVYAIFNMTQDYDVVSKTDKVKEEVIAMSAENGIAYIYLMPGLNESTTDFVYSGYSLIVDDGVVKEECEKFLFESTLIYSDINLNEEINDYVVKKDPQIDKKKLKEGDKFPFIPEKAEDIKKRAKDILEFQSSALARRLKQIGHYKMVLGLSGGSDSTLALIVCAEACKKLGVDPQNIIAITMPGFGTSKRTYENTLALSKQYNTSFREISIKEICIQHYKDIGLPLNDRSVTYENAQARERTQVLMDVANMENAFVIGTGDMSELALGWCTYNGDHMSMYGVNANIPKTMLKQVIKYEAERTNSKVLFDILDTPISPELLPADENGEIAQKTENNIGPYELHDYFLYHFLKYHSTPEHIYKIACEAFKDDYSEEEIKKWLGTFLRRFIYQQFKRNCVPDGPKIGSLGLSPRGDLVLPSDLDATIWKF